MPDLILQVWKLVLLGFIYLFFLRVLRSTWVMIHAPATPPRPQEADPASKPARTGGITKLKVLEPKHLAGQIYTVNEEITIGRAPGCRILLEDTFVSQLHARVYPRGTSLVLEDLGSTNGTFYNNKKVTSPVSLKKGDRVQVGQTLLEATK